MKNFVSCHCHQQSLDSGSTPEAFAKREKELGTGALVVTDHGSLGAVRTVASLAKKNSLHFIPGVEFYFRDDNCPILQKAGVPKDVDNTFSSYNKYFHGTVHAMSQTAYERIVRVLSRAALTHSEQHGQERKALFTWQDLEEIGDSEVTFSSGCLVGMVQRHLINETSRPDLAIQYYERFRSMVPQGNFYIELFPHDCSKDWVKAVFLEFETQNGIKPPERRFWFGKNLRVDIGGEISDMPAYELAGKFEKWNGGHSPKVALVAVKNMHTWVEEPNHPYIIFARTVEDFLKNECTDFSPNGDVQEAANKFMLGLANKYKDQVLVADDSHFAYSDEKLVQDVRLLSSERTKTKGSAPQWRFYSSYHRQSSQEAFAHFQKTLGVPESVFEGWVENSYVWRDRFNWSFKDRKQLPDKFYPADTLPHLMKLIKETGRMNWNDPVWVQRLKDEVKLLHFNGTIDLLCYFFMAQEAIKYYESQGHISSPGRGSAAGLGIAYLLGITHADPLQYGLSKERFLTESRVKSGKLPDVDVDYGRNSRDIITDHETGWLHKRFGDHAAQISTDTMLRLKSSVQDVHRMKDGGVPPEVWKYTNDFQLPPQGITDHNFVFGYNDADGNPVKGSIETDPALKAYATKYPEHWDIVQKCLGIVKGHGRHASAFAVCNEPISNFIPMTLVSGVPVTAYNMKGVEEAGGIKMDFLGISTLDDVEVALKLVQKRSGLQLSDMVLDGKLVPYMRVLPRLEQDGQWHYYDIWKLPEEQCVFNELCDPLKSNGSIFQFGTPSVQKWMPLFIKPDGTATLKTVEDLAVFTALDRPGGLDAYVQTVEGGKRNQLEEYAARIAGKPACVDRFTVLDEMFPETQGVLCFQEQITKAFVVLGGASAEEGDEFRVHISKKQMNKVMADKTVFMKGAVAKLGAADAERMWSSLETFSGYGFNKSHAVCYSLIGYACAYLQHHYPLEWWTAVLRNADRNEIDSVFWQHVSHLIDPPDVKLSGSDFEVQNERIRAPLRLLVGVGPTAHEELTAGRPYTDLKDFLTKIKNKKDAVVDGKKGRSAINTTILLKLVVSGCADGLFPPDKCTDVYTKLTYFNQIDAEVNNIRMKRTGELKVAKVDDRFTNLDPIQRYLLTKSILPSHTKQLVSFVDSMNRTDWKKDGNKRTWHAPKPFEGDEWVQIYPGKAVKAILDGTIKNLPPKCKFGCVAFISESESFWNGKALKVHFEVDGERFLVNLWPKTKYVEGEKVRETAALPAGAVSGVCIVTLSRWDIEKSFTVDDVCVITPAVTLKDKKE